MIYFPSNSISPPPSKENTFVFETVSFPHWSMFFFGKVESRDLLYQIQGINVNTFILSNQMEIYNMYFPVDLAGFSVTNSVLHLVIPAAIHWYPMQIIEMMLTTVSINIFSLSPPPLIFFLLVGVGCCWVEGLKQLPA